LGIGRESGSATGGGNFIATKLGEGPKKKKHQGNFRRDDCGTRGKFARQETQRGGA